VPGIGNGELLAAARAALTDPGEAEARDRAVPVRARAERLLALSRP
jgi:hypothetical protein